MRLPNILVLIIGPLPGGAGLLSTLLVFLSGMVYQTDAGASATDQEDLLNFQGTMSNVITAVVVVQMGLCLVVQASTRILG